MAKKKRKKAASRTGAASGGARAKPRGAPQRRKKGRSRGAALMQRLVGEAPASFSSWHIEEPRLLFAGGHACEDPKTGISLYGPAALDHGARDSVRVGVIGTGDTIQLLTNWLSATRQKQTAGQNKRGKAYDSILFPDFPGFSMDSAFQCEALVDERLCETLSSQDVRRATASGDFRTRVSATVEMVLERIRVLADREPAPDVVVCALPEDIDKACGPQGRVGQIKNRPLTKAERSQRKLETSAARSGQGLLAFVSEGSEATAGHWDLHHALKAHAMRVGLPTQLVWESTLRGTRETQDPATIAWNFYTALYYKAGNVPWELNFPTSSTCFVGVTFYRENPTPSALTRTSLAQVFSENGEGLVLKGEPVTWDTERDRKPHLAPEAATRLLSRAIDLYEEHFRQRPRRVVVHKTSRYWPEELEGFKSGLGEVQSFDFLALERRGLRFLRLGKEPPLRGTVIQVGRRNYLLYTRGYVPFLRSYPGMRIPNPLEIVEHHGDSTAERVCSEIMSLTKLNWNNCAFASGDPITTAFSRQVGHILTEMPEDVTPLAKYRYYM